VTRDTGEQEAHNGEKKGAIIVAIEEDKKGEKLRGGRYVGVGLPLE